MSHKTPNVIYKFLFRSLLLFSYTAWTMLTVSSSLRIIKGLTVTKSHNFLFVSLTKFENDMMKPENLSKLASLFQFKRS